MVLTGEALDMLTLEVTRRLVTQKSVCGETTFDIYLNARAIGATYPLSSEPTGWAATKSSRNGFPTASALSSPAPLAPEEVQHFTDTARRIAMVGLKSRSTNSE